MINVFLPAFLLIFGEVYAEEECSIKFCNSSHPSTRTDVERICENEINGTHMSGRCCILNETGAVIGLDLSSCQIENANFSKSNFTDVVIMDLRENELKSVTPADLIGLANLNYLWIPYWISCPGGDRAWNETHFNDTFCYFQKNPCNYLNISCTANGICKHLGPGSAKCLCKPGHHGYKCMNEGEFPATTFSVSLTVTTVVLSIVLWFAHGRDAYKKR